MPVVKEYHAGPDDPIYKGGLRVSSVLGPSELIETLPTSTAGQNSAQYDPMLPAMNGIEAALKANLAKNYEATE